MYVCTPACSCSLTDRRCVVITTSTPLEVSTPPCVYVRWSSVVVVVFMSTLSWRLRRASLSTWPNTTVQQQCPVYKHRHRMVEASGWGPWQRYDDGRSLARIPLSHARAPALSLWERRAVGGSIDRGWVHVLPPPHTSRYTVIPYRSSTGLDVHFSWVTSVPSRMLSHTLPPYNCLSL